MVWSGWRVIEVVEKQTTLVNESVDIINALAKKYNANRDNIIVDEDGVGGGVKDYLKCKGFVNNSAPIENGVQKENFSNLKTQCYYKLAEQINMNNLYVMCDEFQEKLMKEELEMVRLAKEIDTSKITLMSKDEVKKKIGRSPDYSDALMMRMYFTLDKPKSSYYIG